MLFEALVGLIVCAVVMVFLFAYILPSSTPTESTSSLYSRVSAFYDQTTNLWEQVWGDQLHHGYYGRDGQTRKSDYQAQIDMIDELLSFGGFPAFYAERKRLNQLPIRLVDVGCGVGGSSHYIAKKYPGVLCSGITLSPYQVRSATARALAAGVGSECDFQVANALQTPFENERFDVIYSMESGEHMPDKRVWFGEMDRIMKKGGLIVMATWCHRKLGNVGIEAEDDENQAKIARGEKVEEPTSKAPFLRGPLSSSELAHLNRIRHNYALPAWVSIEEYIKVSRSLGWVSIKSDDWTESTGPFWPAVLRSSLSVKSIVLVLGVGWQAIKSLFTAYLMVTGFNRGLLKFVSFSARKK